MNEVWISIKGCENYQISNLGRLKSLAKEWKCGTNTIRSKDDTIMKWSEDGHGYRLTSVRANGKSVMIYLHRMLAIHFIPNTENKPFINHKDGNPRNNKITNLEWCTHSENIKHAYKLGLMKSPGGYNSKKIKITNNKTGEVFLFPTLIKASIGMNINRGSITQNINKRVTSWKYTFELI